MLIEKMQYDHVYQESENVSTGNVQRRNPWFPKKLKKNSEFFDLSLPRQGRIRRGFSIQAP